MEEAQAPVEETQIQIHSHISLYDDTYDSKYDPKLVFGEIGADEYNGGFQVSLEEMSEGTTEEERDQYISLLREARKDNLTGLCLGSVGNVLVRERYSWTLKEYLNSDESRDTFWEKIDVDYGTPQKLSTHGTYRMSTTLQQLLKNLITKICVMLKENKIYDLHAENVVLNAHSEPKFTNFKIATGKRNVHLWTCFSEIVKEIIEKAPVNLHPEVKDFFDMIEAYEGCNREVLKQHPALISEYKKYNFLVRIQEMFESGNGYAYRRDCARDFVEWEKDLKSCWPFGMKMISECLKNGGDGGEQTERFEPHVRYIYCMLNLRAYLNSCGDENLDLPIKKLIRAFDGVHPTFASYVFRRYVSGKRVIGDQLGIEIEDLTFTIFDE